MKTCREMRREAWGILRGKWFWRLLAAGLLLQAIAFAANRAVLAAFVSLEITTVDAYAQGWASAASQGLAYSLPTARAYAWMIGGFLLQMFIAYIFAAIFAFGFAGLLLKARADDESRWLGDAFGGFSRPLDVTGLLLLMNVAIGLVALGWALVFGGALAVAFRFCPGIALRSPEGLGLLAGAAVLAAICALPAAYAYRQAWFVKSENPALSAVACLRASRRMMKGFKAKAFELDLSYFGWFALSGALFFASCICAAVARGFPPALAGTLLFGAAAFWTLLKAALGAFVARAVFYRELPGADVSGVSGAE